MSSVVPLGPIPPDSVLGRALAQGGSTRRAGSMPQRTRSSRSVNAMNQPVTFHKKAVGIHCDLDSGRAEMSRVPGSRRAGSRACEHMNTTSSFVPTQILSTALLLVACPFLRLLRCHGPSVVRMATTSSPAMTCNRSLLRRSFTSRGLRPVCNYGTQCYRRNPEHLKEHSHPWDDDYLFCCEHIGKKPEFCSIRKLFEWADNGTGRATRERLESHAWPEIQRLAPDVGPLTDELWSSLDDDGNGYINFGEFAEFTTKMRVDLPLGLDDLLGTINGTSDLKCGVFECSCTKFVMQRRRCKYGATCYQKNEEHRSSFSHPDQDDWETAVGPGGKEMCRCGHKKKLHASAACGVAAVSYPEYWSSTSLAASSSAPDSGLMPQDEFCVLPEVSVDMTLRLKQLVDATYSDVTTRDRQRHSGSWMVPRGFEVVSALRNENSKLWRKYCVKKAELQQEKKTAADCGFDWQVFSDVLTTRFWAAYGDRLDAEINEWYLWHGTSNSAAHNICRSDFKMRLAGSATGTLYGRGSYLAESITKADEYSREEDGLYTVLLCRVLGGRVRYTDERTPDPDALTRECTQGDYDCILGDRIKISGTYREFIVFDTENVYPEYIVRYRRGELFKSPSHP
eukprot:s846_g3.t1